MAQRFTNGTRWGRNQLDAVWERLSEYRQKSAKFKANVIVMFSVFH